MSNNLEISIGECSICGYQAEFDVVQRHFDEEHLNIEDEANAQDQEEEASQ